MVCAMNKMKICGIVHHHLRDFVFRVCFDSSEVYGFYCITIECITQFEHWRIDQIK